MKFISIPTSIEVGAGGKFSLADYIRFVLDNDQRFAGNAAGIRRAMRIDKALGESPLALETEDYEVLKSAILTPNMAQGIPAYPVTRARSLIPFIEAIESATDERPGKTTNGAEAHA